MGSGNVYVGYECRPCGMRIGTMAVASTGASSGPVCSKCGRMMTPVQGEGPELVTNVHCRSCNSIFGAISSTGPVRNCPNCDALID